MKQKLIFLIFFSSSMMFSQTSFSHAAGIAGYFGTRNANSVAAGITYSPRFNFFRVSENSTLSIGSHIGLGYNITNREANSFSYHLPVVLEFNFGHASDKTKYENGFGGFIGFGYSIDNTQRSSYYYNGFTSINIVENDVIKGPMVNLGMRFKFLGKSAGIRFSYLYGTGDFEGGYMSSLGFQYNIGVQ
ncbi:hypothetical protein [Xanthomarina gelatinilytica]|uniref:hypothetical protein n=1 Tax=Xanthomarina gelatinilytica TaxID=1137281 RepID=UPI002C6D6C49|nr:hypothetical protein [Xanthomarina sp.]